MVLWAAVSVLGLIIAAGAFVLSGIYNVAASRGHFAITASILELAMRQSVKAHSRSMQSPPLDDPDLIGLGAAHYQGGCTPCHGAPGEPNNPIVKSMLPPPSHLPRAVKEWTPDQLFWIVKNGLKYTGMPAWVAPERDDEVWAVVAFLRQLPVMAADDYRSLAIGNADQLNRTAREIVHFGSDAASISACARCHGSETSPPSSRLVPKLAGQSAEYLRIALGNYAQGLRPSGIMQPVASELDPSEVERITNYYSSLSVQREEPKIAAASSEQIARGRNIAQTGISASDIPPCLSCHGATGRPTYPRLAGQNGNYIVGQLKLFQNGVRSNTPQGAIMTTIAQRLAARDIDDAAAFFEQLEPGDDGLSSGILP